MVPGSLRAVSRLLLQSLLVGVFACRSWLDPLPEGTRSFSPPPVYQVWWHLVEACSGLTGNMSSIEWAVVPDVAEFDHDGAPASGYWSGTHRRIVLAERASMDGGLVRHEMLHALRSELDHSREMFLERCGGLVVCLTRCVRDGGPPPGHGAAVARVLPSAMLVDVDVDPVQPSLSVDEGHFRLIVTATNPSADSVVVQLPSSGDTPPYSFNFKVQGAKFGLWFTEFAWDPGITLFAPGGKRRWVFDFRVKDTFDGVRGLPVGTYEVKGGFGPALSAARPFVLSP